MPERLELGIGLDEPARARRWIRGFCESRDLAHLGEEAALLVTELVTNAIVHASADCVVLAEERDDELHVEVIDGDPNLADVRPDIDPLTAENGRGLLIVAGLAGAWGVQERPDGKAVWFTLPTDRVAEIAPAGTPIPEQTGRCRW